MPSHLTLILLLIISVNRVCLIISIAAKSRYKVGLLLHHKVISDPIYLLFEMSFSLNGLRLHRGNRFLFRLQLELESLKFVLVIRTLTVNFLSPVA